MEGTTRSAAKLADKVAMVNRLEVELRIVELELAAAMMERAADSPDFGTVRRSKQRARALYAGATGCLGRLHPSSEQRTRLEVRLQTLRHWL